MGQIKRGWSKRTNPPYMGLFILSWANIECSDGTHHDSGGSSSSERFQKSSSPSSDYNQSLAGALGTGSGDRLKVITPLSRNCQWVIQESRNQYYTESAMIYAIKPGCSWCIPHTGYYQCMHAPISNTLCYNWCQCLTGNYTACLRCALTPSCTRLAFSRLVRCFFYNNNICQIYKKSDSGLCSRICQLIKINLCFTK